jgi:C1A family cysteine protease
MGMSVYESFESLQVKRTGVVPMPKPNERLLGGHAVLVISYRDESQSFIVRNSWGATWGRSGYFFLPYDYLMSRNRYAWDFWTLLELAAT